MIAIVFSVLIMAASAAAEPATQVCLNSLAIVDQDTITLGDVATIESPDPGVARALGSLPVSAAPQPAHAMVIQKKDMELLLVRHGVELRHLGLKGPDMVQVVREGQIVEPEEILAAIREHIQSRTGWGSEDFSLEQAWGVQEVSLPSGPYKIGVQLLSDETSQDPRFRVTISQTEKEKRTLIVAVRVCRFVNTYVARRDIARGKRFSLDDLELRRLDQNRLSSRQVERLIRSPESVVGREARFAIPAGRPFTSDMVQPPTVIERGERIVIQLVHGAVRVSGPGIARQSGKIGQNLQVQNLATGKYVYARVTGPGIVSID